MREIPLTQGYIAVVDDEDFDRLSRFRWAAKPAHRTTYARRREAHRLCDAAGNERLTYRYVWMHREVIGPVADQQVDHVDGNGLNNARRNLRPCTNAENQRNMRKTTKPTASRYKGVRYVPAGNRGSIRTKPWRARIKLHGVARSLGYYGTEVAAAHAYDTAAVKLFGQFARLNFPVLAESA